MSPPPNVAKAYSALLEHVILSLRMRLRYGEVVSLEEVHDFLDALHNVPIMLRSYGDWHVEENINSDLQHYDDRWLKVAGAQFRISLVDTLRKVQAGEFDLAE